MASAYPLTWPQPIPRTKTRFRSRFGDKTVAVSLRALKDELDRLGARSVVISTNIPLKANGDPYSDPGKMPDPGCAIYFQLKGKSYCFPCDRWASVEENMYAVAKHIEAMRGMERWGVGSIEQMFTGFAQLPATTQRDWWEVFQLPRSSSRDVVEGRYRLLAQERHPDKGGSHAAMAELNIARDQALQELGGK